MKLLQIKYVLLLLFQMELGSITMSPPYDNDEDILFPDLISTMESLEGDISGMLSSTSKEEPCLGSFPNIVNVDDTDMDGEDEEVAVLKRLSREQKKKEKLSNLLEITDSQLQKPNTTSQSNVSSSTPETVMILPGKDGTEQIHFGPNRNAIMAKLNRQKKKQQMSDLEKMVTDLSQENEELKIDQCNLKSQVTSLESEVEYLKGVLANQSELSSLLKNVKATSLSFHSSIGDSATPKQSTAGIENKRPCPSVGKEGPAKRHKLTKGVTKSAKVTNRVCLETIETQTARYSVSSRSSSRQKSALYEDALREKASSDLKGVCLHVRDKKVSLEFCRSCSRRAEAAFIKEEEDE